MSRLKISLGYTHSGVFSVRRCIETSIHRQMKNKVRYGSGLNDFD